MDPKFVDALQKIADSSQKLAAIFALIVGGIWVLRTYLLDHTHEPRLQVNVKAEISRHASGNYLLASIEVKNVGRSRIELPPLAEDGDGLVGCALLVLPQLDDEDVDDIISPRWGETYAFGVLDTHRSVEAGLTLYEQKLVRLPQQPHLSYRVRLNVTAEGQVWLATAVAMAGAGGGTTNWLWG